MEIKRKKWFEIWYSDGVDICPTYILLVTSDENGNFLIKDPFKDYKTVFTVKSYEEVYSELNADDYYLVDGRILIDED
jgi:hypothetical protein